MPFLKLRRPTLYLNPEPLNPNYKIKKPSVEVVAGLRREVLLSVCALQQGRGAVIAS